MIYLDHNATTRPLPEVVAAVRAAMEEGWANPSSKHAPGQESKEALGEARRAVAQLLGAQPVEVVFTSGATESNHMAMLGALKRPGAPRRILLSAIEHAGYLKAALQLREEGVTVELIPVDADGRLRLDALAAALKTPAALVSVMAANNETGVLQPIAEVVQLAKAQGLPVHVDATALVGKQPFDFATSGIDLLTLSAHKLHGPQGVGALILRKGLVWPALIVGQQERGRRGGTENQPGIAGFAVAAAQAQAELSTEATRVAALRDALERGLQMSVSGVTVFGAQAARVPNTSYLSIAGCSADQILNWLERWHIFAASGAACSSGGAQTSHVLLAMGVAPELARGAVRLSLGRDTQAADIDAVINALAALAPRSGAATPAPRPAAVPL